MQGRVGAPPLTYLRGVLAKAGHAKRRGWSRHCIQKKRRRCGWIMGHRRGGIPTMNYESRSHLIDKQTMLAPAALIERK
jgi:hypothetical protein